jgi:hypothetical protein
VEIFTILLGAVVVTASSVMVAVPLMRGTGDNLNDKNLEVDKETSFDKIKKDIFVILNEIEFDYKSQKLSEQDYQFLKNKYQKQVVAILKVEEVVADKKFSSAQLKELQQQVEEEIARELEKTLS